MVLPRITMLTRGLSAPLSLHACLLTGLKRCSSLMSTGTNCQGREPGFIPHDVENHSAATKHHASFSQLASKSTETEQSCLLRPISLEFGLLGAHSGSYFFTPLNQQEEYKCPSRLPETFSQMVILDNQTAIKSFYECPVPSSIVETIKAPTVQKSEFIEGPGRSSPAKETKSILKIRHKKMKKHKLKKLRKRMYFLWRKQKLARRAKRMAIYWKEIEEIKKTGEDFNAESFVREQLGKARKSGYYRNVFESNVH